MDWQRTLLLGGIAIVVVMLFQEWNKFEQQHKPVVDTSTVVETAVDSEIPADPAGSQAVVDDEVPTIAGEEPEPVQQTDSSSQLISVKTDVLDVLINPVGGDIVKVAFPQHLKKLGREEPFILLNNNSSTTYLAKSGLAGTDGTDKRGKARPLFSADATEYELSGDRLNVDLHYRQGEVNITKRFTFRKGDYLVDVGYVIDNNSAKDWKAALYAQIKRDSSRPETDAGFGMQPFVGAALTTPDENYVKYSFDDIAERTFEETYNGGWVAMLQHYFMSAWVPPQEQQNTYQLRKLKDGNYLMGYFGPLKTVPAGQTAELKTQFYAGPKDQQRLAEIAPYLDKTIDYGWAWWISEPLFWLLNKIYALVANWGWAIMLLTFCVRIPMYPLFAKSARSMAGMRKIQPEMQRLKELYGDDRQKMSQEMMGLYKKHKVNPMGGCLPMLLPMPIFLGLYYMLFESVELRHADWLWIADLSVKDPFFILPLIMGLTMWFQQKLNPQPAEASMATAMKLMPIMFTFMFMWFPAGLVLYWTVNNVFSIAQSYVVNKKLGV